MHLGIYRFEGDPGDLLPGYDRLVQMIPAGNIAWHLCAVEDDGIVVYDTCPTEEAFVAFSTSPQFRDAIDAAGLPQPSITGRPVHNALPR
jgi:hypothetical protein